MHWAPSGWTSVGCARGLLAVSYLLGTPAGVVAEYGNAALSGRFGLPPELIFLSSAIQIAGAVGILTRFAFWAALALTATTIGATGCHLSMDSPVTALPALLYTVVQVWVARRVRGSGRGDGTVTVASEVPTPTPAAEPR